SARRALCDISTAADVTNEGAICFKARRAGIEQPTVFTIFPAQAILDREWFPFAKRSPANIEAMRQILGVNSLQPSGAQFLFQATTGEFQPALVEKNALFVRAGHPNHHG